MVTSTSGQRWLAAELLERAVRVGYAARAVLYTVVAMTALSVAVGRGGDTQSSSGALRSLASQPFGTAMLVVIATGLAGYSVWRLVQAFRTDEGDHPLANAWYRLYYAGRGVLYGFLAASAVRIVLRSGGGGGRSESSMAAQAMQLPGGRWLVGAIGLGLAAYGLRQGYRAFATPFEEELETARMGPREVRWVTRVGVAGYLARMVVFGLMGAFVVGAAVTFDPDKARGFDGALQALAGTTYGPWLLGTVAVGLLGFALFSAAESRYRRVETE